jgi:hypothetical protein
MVIPAGQAEADMAVAAQLNVQIANHPHKVLRETTHPVIVRPLVNQLADSHRAIVRPGAAHPAVLRPKKQGQQKILRAGKTPVNPEAVLPDNN